MTKQHPKRERIVHLIEAGNSDRRIHDRLKVSRKYIRQVRIDIGIAPYSITNSVENQLKRFTSIPDPDGHVWWTGTVGSNGVPRVRSGGKEISATHAIFEARAGRKPQGQVRPGCTFKRCMAPRHLMDDLERRKVRLQVRALMGYPDHWDECPACGSSWEEEGRVEEKLSLYCRRCTTERARRNREGTGS